MTKHLIVQCPFEAGASKRLTAHAERTSRATRAATIGALITFALFALALFFGGCATSPTALTHEASVYTVATNVVAGVATVAPFLPPPFCSIFEGLTMVSAAILAAWNAWQHSQIKTLQTDASTASVTAAIAAGTLPTGPAS